MIGILLLMFYTICYLNAMAQDIKTKHQTPNDEWKSNLKNYFRHNRILIKDCDCYRSLDDDKLGTNKSTTTEVQFNNRRVSGSFCSPVRKNSRIHSLARGSIFFILMLCNNLILLFSIII